MKLISEYTESNIEFIVEDKENGKGKKYIIEGIFASIFIWLLVLSIV